MYDVGNVCGEKSVSEVHGSAIIEQADNSRSCSGSQLTVSPQLISSTDKQADSLVLPAPGTLNQLEMGSAPHTEVVETPTVMGKCGGGASVGVAPTTAEGGLMHRLAQLVQMQTGMVVAQTQAMSTQSLHLLPRHSGEGDQAMDDGFDRWVDQFEERARLVGWSDDLCCYHLKMLLSKLAFQAYRLLPELGCTDIVSHSINTGDLSY